MHIDIDFSFIITITAAAVAVVVVVVVGILIREEMKGGVPKGRVAVMVGGKGEEQQRFVIPVIYINHPLFLQLLKEAEEVYGFDHSGPINIPCHVEEFRHVWGLIHQDTASHHHNHSTWCFKIKAAAAST